MRGLVDQYDDSLIGKEKAAHTSRAKRGNFSLLPIGRQIPASCWRAEPLHVHLFLETVSAITTNIPLPSPFPKLLLVSTTSYDV